MFILLCSRHIRPWSHPSELSFRALFSPQVKVAGLYGHFDCVKLMVAIGGTFNEDDIAAILERGESNKEEIVRFLREEAPLLRAHAIVKRQCRGVDAAQVSDGGAAATHSEAAAAESSPAPTPAEAAPSSSASASPASASASSPPRIMLSYQWDHQPLVKRLAERIKQSGYHVWLDVEQMSGSTLEAMAGAVEGSSAVVMCLSAKYQASRNCRLEGEYAHLVSKPIVPVLLTPWPWRATSWLGLITGSKLYFDFTEDAQFEAKVAELLAELHRTVGPPSGSHAALPAGASSQAAASSSAALPSAVAAPAAAVASASSAASACAPAPVSAASASDSSATVESKWLLDTHGIALRQPLDAACLQELHKLQVRIEQ